MEEDIKLGENIQEFEEIFGNVPIKDLEKIREYIKRDYIPKSKVKEEIEEINKEELNYNEDYYWFEQEVQGYAIDKLQKLLQEGDK